MLQSLTMTLSGSLFVEFGFSAEQYDDVVSNCCFSYKVADAFFLLRLFYSLRGHIQPIPKGVVKRITIDRRLIVLYVTPSRVHTHYLYTYQNQRDGRRSRNYHRLYWDHRNHLVTFSPSCIERAIIYTLTNYVFFSFIRTEIIHSTC